MHLTFQGRPEIAAPHGMVWRRLLDADAIAACFPGVTSVRPIDDRHFQVHTEFGVGFLTIGFNLAVELFDLEPEHRARMRARGHAPGSEVEIVTAIALRPLAPRRVQLDWEATADISGAVARLGGRLVERAARAMTDEFWRRFAAQATAADKGATDA